MSNKIYSNPYLENPNSSLRGTADLRRAMSTGSLNQEPMPDLRRAMSTGSLNQEPTPGSMLGEKVEVIASSCLKLKISDSNFRGTADLRRAMSTGSLNQEPMPGSMLGGKIEATQCRKEDKAKKELGRVYSRLGRIYLKEKKDIDKAIRYYKLEAKCLKPLADGGDPGAKGRLGRVYSRLGRIYLKEKKDIDKAIRYYELEAKCFEPLADGGDPRAKGRLGKVYAEIGSICLEEKEDIDKAIRYYELEAKCFEPLADGGDPGAKGRLGRVYAEIGSICLGEKKDIDKAIKYFELAVNGMRPLAGQVDFKAKRELGLVYSEMGYIYLKEREDADKAIEYFELALKWLNPLANAEDPKQVDLEGKKELGKRLLKWLSPLAKPEDSKQVDPEVKKRIVEEIGLVYYGLGYIYEVKKGGIDEAKAVAIEYYKIAARLGSVAAQFTLFKLEGKKEVGKAGHIYPYGRGNINQVILCFKSQAELGDLDALMMMGRVCQYDKRDFAHAMRYFYSAVRQGSFEAHIRLISLIQENCLLFHDKEGAILSAKDIFESVLAQGASEDQIRDSLEVIGIDKAKQKITDPRASDEEIRQLHRAFCEYSYAPRKS